MRVITLLLLTSCADDMKTSNEGFEFSEVEDAGASLDTPADTGSGDSNSGDSNESESHEAGLDERVFGMKAVYSQLMPDIFNADDLEESLITHLYLVHWTRDGTSVAWTERLCSANATPTHGNQLSFSDSYIDNTPVRQHEGTLSSAEVAANFVVPQFVALNAVELDDPWNDTLPTTDDDERVFDQDLDGNAGFTISVDAGMIKGDLYLVDRTMMSMNGVVVAQDRIEAHLTFTNEQSILGASHNVFTWVELGSVSNPDENASYAIFQQMDADATCNDVLAEASTLF